MSTIEERIAATAAEAEATKDDLTPYPPGSVTRPGLAGSVVQSVRLPADEFERIKAIAEEADVPVSALIRGWVLGASAAERDMSLDDALDRLAASAEQVRRLAERSAA